MPKQISSKLNTLTLFMPILLILYLCVGFIPNLGAVDKIAPQWLAISYLNLLSVVYFIKNKNLLSSVFSIRLKSKLTLIYFCFILWALASSFYAINPTETIVNCARQLNVFLMFVSMTILCNGLKNRLWILIWVLTIILSIELYAVLNDALEVYRFSNKIIGGQLKGVTANRNITAFSIAIKIPFVLYHLHINNKLWVKFLVISLISTSLVCLSMIQSRASFVAVGLLSLAYIGLNIFLNFKVKNKKNQLINTGFVIIPIIISIAINQVFLSSKGADVISRASTIALDTNDNSINQRLRYYEDVVTHMTSNPIFGVGLGNWKLKSIDYDSKDINGYIVPYHAHSDFIQLGAELGIIGFFLYMSIFLVAVFYGYKLIIDGELNIDKKIFVFMLLVALGVYTIDANLNFPIARPQVIVVWSLIIGLLTNFYQNEQNKISKIRTEKKLNSIFLIASLAFLFPSIYINNSVYNSLKGQMILLQDFNSNSFNLPLNKVDNIVPGIPNITVTTIPINSVKARYYVNAKKYDKAIELLDQGTNANPYLYYSEILKSQIFQEKGQLDSAKIYAKKAFFGLPNNELHSSRYINLINITRDREALEEAFEILTQKNNQNNWKNYLIVASGLYPPRDKVLMEHAKKATKLFPSNTEFQGLYRQISVGAAGLNLASQFSAQGLEFFNKQDYKNAAQQFEKAIEANPLDYAYFENAATANYMIGNLEKAEQQIDMVIKDLNPLNGKCEYIKALIYIKMGDPIGACPLLATSRDSGFSQAEAIFDQYCR